MYIDQYLYRSVLYVRVCACAYISIVRASVCMCIDQYCTCECVYVHRSVFA